MCSFMGSFLVGPDQLAAGRVVGGKKGVEVFVPTRTLESSSTSLKVSVSGSQRGQSVFAVPDQTPRMVSNPTYKIMYVCLTVFCFPFPSPLRAAEYPRGPCDSGVPLLFWVWEAAESGTGGGGGERG